MINFAVDFRWIRPVGLKRAYRWNAGALEKIPGAVTEEYEPLTDATGLFQEFAELPNDPNAFLRFAQRHGALEREGEPLDEWQHQVKVMKDHVSLYDGLTSENAATSIAQLRYVANRLVETLGVFSQIRALDVAWDTKKKSAIVRLRPPSLLEFMWLQFGIAIVSASQYQKCEKCGRWFRLQPGINRAGKRHCSTTCKVAAYRNRRSQAKKLHAKGWSAAKIAKHFGSGVSTVETWISTTEK